MRVDPAWNAGRRSSASTFVHLRSQCAGRELSAAAKGTLAEPPGLLIIRPKAPMDYSGKVSVPAP